MGILGAGGFVFLGEEDGEPDVEDEAGEKANTGDPDAGSVEEGVEEVGVFIKGLRADKNEEVPREVTGQKEDKGEAGDGDDEFAADRRFCERAEGAGRSTHGS